MSHHRDILEKVYPSVGVKRTSDDDGVGDASSACETTKIKPPSLLPPPPLQSQDQRPRLNVCKPDSLLMCSSYPSGPIGTEFRRRRRRRPRFGVYCFPSASDGNRSAGGGGWGAARRFHCRQNMWARHILSAGALVSLCKCVRVRIPGSYSIE